MKHDERCELKATGGRDCHCASRAFRADPIPDGSEDQ